MSRRVLVCGGPAARRDHVARSIDAALDVDIEACAGPLAATRLLPNRDLALLVVLAEAEPGEARGIELVRLVSDHAHHRRTALVFVGGHEAERLEAGALGARLLEPEAPDTEVRALVRDLLGLG